MLEVQGLTTGYGNIRAIREVDLAVPEGRIVCIIGANGAGKTTLLRTIAGLLRPKGGTITFLREEITALPPAQIVRRGIVLVPEGRAILSRMTVFENLEMGAYQRRDGRVREEIEATMERFPILKKRRNLAGGSLSGGEQQMLAIARALLARPKLLLLDEPSLGLAPLVVSHIFRIIREINREGTTVLLVEQNVRQALRVSQFAYVLETGKIVHEGPSPELLNDPKIQESYLGGGRP
jgi:branched-chain amino acid transport system ATP-binding protein